MERAPPHRGARQKGLTGDRDGSEDDVGPGDEADDVGARRQRGGVERLDVLTGAVAAVGHLGHLASERVVGHRLRQG